MVDNNGNGVCDEDMLISWTHHNYNGQPQTFSTKKNKMDFFVIKDETYFPPVKLDARQQP